jgi:hypothetical protein
MTRAVIFLGVFSLLLVLGLTASAVLVELGVLRSLGHSNLGWASAPIFLLYVVLSLRWIVRNARASKAV